jgi:hypothetical protein
MNEITLTVPPRPAASFARRRPSVELCRAAPFRHTVEHQNPPPTGGAGQPAQAQTIRREGISPLGPAATGDSGARGLLPFASRYQLGDGGAVQRLDRTTTPDCSPRPKSLSAGSDPARAAPATHGLGTALLRAGCRSSPWAGPVHPPA